MDSPLSPFSPSGRSRAGPRTPLKSPLSVGKTASRVNDDAHEKAEAEKRRAALERQRRCVRREPGVPTSVAAERRTSAAWMTRRARTRLRTRLLRWR